MYFHFVMEYCSGGELIQRVLDKGLFKSFFLFQIGTFSEKQTAMTMRKLFSAIHYLHQIGIVHRDLKPENIVYKSCHANSEIKIIDFGLSKKCKDVHAKR